MRDDLSVYVNHITERLQVLGGEVRKAKKGRNRNTRNMKGNYVKQYTVLLQSSADENCGPKSITQESPFTVHLLKITIRGRLLSLCHCN